MPWFATLDTTAARQGGLTTRPLADTLAAALEYKSHRDQTRATGPAVTEEQALRHRLAR